MATIDITYTAAKTASAFMRSDAFFRLLQGPIGGGKTVTNIMEIARRCAEMPPGKDGVRRSRWAIIRNTRQQLKDTTLKTWLDWIKPGVLGRWKESEMTFEMRFNDVHADILFRPLDSPEDVQRVLSLELSGAFINESRELPLAIVEALMGRIGRFPKRDDVPVYWCGLLADTNPPEIDSDWYKIAEGIPIEEDNLNSIMECDSFKQPSGLSAEAENKENLRPNYYEDLARGKTKAWVDTYIHGLYSPSQAGKPVYSNTFKQERHVSVMPLKIDPALPVIIGFDTGLTPAATFKQMGLDGRVRVLREAAAFDMGMKRFIQHYLRPIIKNFFPANPLIFIGDPAGVRRGDGDENSAFKVLKEAFSDDGAIVKAASTNDPKVRIQATEQMLCQYPEGDPLYQVDPSCKRLIEGLRSKYRYSKMKQSGNYSEAPEKNAWGHLVEGDQYSNLFLQSGRYDPSAYMRVTSDPFGFAQRQPYRPAQKEGY